MLTVGRVGDRHPLLASLGLHGRDVKDEVGALNALAGRGRAPDLAVLAEGVADAADLQVLLGHLDLPAHRLRLASIFAVGMRIVRLEEHLILLAFSEDDKK